MALINTEWAYADSVVNNHDMNRIIAIFGSQMAKTTFYDEFY